jgi:multidrug/hemolysin transport system permease protein
MRGVFAEMEKVGFPSQVVEGIKDSIDVNLYFFGKSVPLSAMFAVLFGAVVLFTGLFVLLHVLRRHAKTY